MSGIASWSKVLREVLCGSPKNGLDFIFQTIHEHVWLILKMFCLFPRWLDVQMSDLLVLNMRKTHQHLLQITPVSISSQEPEWRIKRGAGVGRMLLSPGDWSRIPGVCWILFTGAMECVHHVGFICLLNWYFVSNLVLFEQESPLQLPQLLFSSDASLERSHTP